MRNVSVLWATETETTNYAFTELQRSFRDLVIFLHKDNYVEIAMSDIFWLESLEETTILGGLSDNLHANKSKELV